MTRNIGAVFVSVVAVLAKADAKADTKALARAAPLEVIEEGVTICRAGYVMDAYRIEDGWLVTRPDVMALEGPNLYDVASLVDLPEATSSAFHILDEPGAPGPRGAAPR